MFLNFGRNYIKEIKEKMQKLNSFLGLRFFYINLVYGYITPFPHDVCPLKEVLGNPSFFEGKLKALIEEKVFRANLEVLQDKLKHHPDQSHYKRGLCLNSLYHLGFFLRGTGKVRIKLHQLAKLVLDVVKIFPYSEGVKFYIRKGFRFWKGSFYLGHIKGVVSLGLFGIGGKTLKLIFKKGEVSNEGVVTTTAGYEPIKRMQDLLGGGKAFRGKVVRSPIVEKIMGSITTVGANTKNS